MISVSTVGELELLPLDPGSDALHPLNALRSLHPDVYEHEKAKYAGREAVLDFRIPIIDVLWNDTIHLAPIHPHHLAEAWRRAGLDSLFWSSEFLPIPVDRVAWYPPVWFASESFWVNNSPNEDVPLAPPDDEFRVFEPAEYRELDDVPPSYDAYLERQKARGERALQFPEIPHVLVAGSIDVSGLEPVRLDKANG